MALVVFDLDFTLWDCGGVWVDCTQPPFRLDPPVVLDARDRACVLYPQVPEILDLVEETGHHLALASRTHRPEWARELLDLFEVGDRFAYSEIYPGSKVPHFHALREKSGFPFEEILFFDDEDRNIDAVGQLGVTAILVEDGLNLELVAEGLKRLPPKSEAS